MSYYSSYSLRIIAPKSDDRDYYHGIMNPQVTSAEAEVLLSELNFYENWNTFEEDMLATSKNYPELIFEVEREGEESPDFEMIRFKNGAMESVFGRIVWPDFDTILSDYEQVQEQSTEGV